MELGGCSVAHDMVLQIPGRGSPGLLTFDLDSVADLLPGHGLTAF